jgi:hypothetical protein
MQNEKRARANSRFREIFLDSRNWSSAADAAILRQDADWTASLKIHFHLREWRDGE